MIIDKVALYWTAEDQDRKKEIEQKVNTISDEIDEIQKKRDALNSDSPASDTQTEDIDRLNVAFLERLDTLKNLFDEEGKLEKEVEARYIKGNSKKTILADIKEIVNAFEKEDFVATIEDRKSIIIERARQGRSEKELVWLKKSAVENYENCYDFIFLYLEPQFKALADDEASVEKAINMIKKRVALWYVEPQPAYLPMAHGKATDALAFMSTKNATIDRYSKTATIEKFGVQLAILKLQELHATLGVNTDKLLSTATALFTKQNNFNYTKTQTTPKREVTISLKEYAKWCGYDVEEHETSTPEEAEREKKRAKAQLDNARKAIKKDLDIIHSSTLTWEETIKGKPRDFARVSIVTYTGIRNGEIKIAFSPEIASYLVENRLITQYPTKLLKIDARQPNAYYIGRKLLEHYNIDGNKIRGTHDRISIPKLLEVTNLASYEEVQKTDRGHWAERIKEPLEQALDTLTQEGVLENWEYTHAKGLALTDDEAREITSYGDFAKLYLHFVPADTVDDTERIQKKRKQREDAIKRKKEAKKKKQ